MRVQYPGRSYEEQWAGVAFPSRREKQRLAKALSQLKDATTLDARLALILLQINGLDNALAFLADLDRSRRSSPPPIASDALILEDVPRTAQTRDEVYTWAREHIPLTDVCVIWGNWREDGQRHPVVYVRLLPFVAYWLCYEAIFGQIQEGMDLEPCADFRCVNPRHLRLAPQKPRQERRDTGESPPGA
jgi:hypothetical protein